jgi:3-oxoacyl-[acyl-carrier-protein] synthase-1
MRCALAAMGTANTLGSTRDAVWSRLVAGDASRLAWLAQIVPDREIPFGLVQEALPEIPRALARQGSRNNALALAALREIEPAVRATLARVGRDRFGVVMGTSTSGVSDAEAAVSAAREGAPLPPRFDYAQLEPGSVAVFLAEVLGVGGPAFVVSTACSSSAKALASARSLLDLGVCDAVLAGGVDTLCGLTTNGFSALQALSPERTNPMSGHRRGLTLGEGAAMFLVTREDGEIELLGVGESSEAHHMSAPDPTGGGAEVAMRSALEDAALPPEAVGYLNLHGTGTPQNDAMESLAVARVFGSELPCSSSKPQVGHTLGAAGALEAALCWLALDRIRDERMSLPPHVFDGQPDPELPGLRLVACGDEIDVRGGAVVASNSFGFGGSNCTLVLRRKMRC